MKIKRLTVPEYKNVAVDLELHSDLITLLVGQNGMGKSNLLEILLLIFDELNQLASGRRPSEDDKTNFDFTLEYECRGHHYKAVKKDGLLSLWQPDSLLGEEGFEMMLSKIPFEALPNQIVGYYSGENKRIKELVSKHIKREESSKRRRYSKGDIREFEPKRLFFAENRHSMLVLTTLLLYQNHSTYGANIKKVLQDIVHIGGWDRIHLRFRNPSFAKMGNLRKQGQCLENYHEMLTQGSNLEDVSIFWGIRGNVDKLLRLLLYYAIDYSKDYSIFRAERGVREFFDIGSIPIEKEFQKLLFDRFPSPMSFLNTLEECFVLNMVEEFDITLQKEGEKTYYPYLQLSEGEQQYLTVMGLVALSQGGQDETLFLLDEPDTHINPQWQRSYIEQIEKLCDTQAERDNKVFFISTHSPLLVQANSPGSRIVDLLLFKRGENGKIQIDTEEDVVSNWRIDQVLMSKYFDLPSSRPASLDAFMERRKAIVEGSELMDDKNNLMADKDEFGYLPTGETLADVEAMAYIHEMAARIKREGHL